MERMEFPHDHPLVRHLLPLEADASPEDRLAATLRAYRDGTGESVALPLTVDARKAVRDWLVAEEFGFVDETGHGYALLSKKEAVTKTLIYSDAATKANHLHQTPCLTCIPDPSRTPLRVSFPVRTRPFSAQSLSSGNLAVLKEKIRRHPSGCTRLHSGLQDRCSGRLSRLTLTAHRTCVDLSSHPPG